MIRSFILLALSILICFRSLHAQERCGFDEKHKDLLQSDPGFARRLELSEALIKKHIKARLARRPGDDPQTLATVTIPLVVHVMHTGGETGSIYNPTDTQIMDAINELNEIYAGTLPGMSAPVEGGGVVDMKVQFALAQRTPSCGATTGIVRVDASSLPDYVANGVSHNGSSGCPELTLKDFSRWDPSKYYNIWLVNKAGSASGYAYLPGSAAYLDGIIMQATQMRRGQKTLAHEMGHGMGLYHPFHGSGNDTECPSNTDCSNQGDKVCDTDPVFNNKNINGVFNFSCRSGDNPCAGGVPYTINTESNFMSYTNCYTLFSNGQKARVQAALALPSRASLIDPGNLALVPCGTPLNFAQANASHTEEDTDTTTSCRSYRDYSYQMVVYGNGPSQSATATLSYGGTAVKGLDYDVTTNGDFDSPSDVLSFAAGSAAPQSFTVRIYDDGNVEPDETIILDFSVNDGGGDAVKGAKAPTLTLTLSDNDLHPVASITGTSSIGTSTHIMGTQSWFRSDKLKHRNQMLITREELNAAGINGPADLTSLRCRIKTKNSTKPYNGFTVSLGNTSNTGFPAGFITSGLTQVYSGNYTTAVGNNDIVFSSPFAWDGVSNIVINTCFENTTTDASHDKMEGSDPTPSIIYTTFSNHTTQATAACSLNRTFTSNGRANISFGYSIAKELPVETQAGSFSTHYIDTASNDYFYSNNNRLLMHLSNIDTTLDCVAASVEEGGTTWIDYRGGKRSAKVFHVTPATNKSTAVYTASFYFHNSELEGKNPTGLRLVKTSATSAGESNEDNTFTVKTTVTALGRDVTVFSASCRGFSRFFLIDDQVKTIKSNDDKEPPLPVTLTDFTVKLNNDNDAVLNWITASELNNQGFEVEMSRDGSNFIVLGSVASQGDASTQQSYEYLHVRPQPGTTFYRLKQTDIDGKFEYSKIISLYINNNLAKATVYPVPAKDKITINFGSTLSKTEIEIFSADMKIVKREIIAWPLSTRDINIGNLAKGIYFMRYRKDNAVEILRFIKE